MQSSPIAKKMLSSTLKHTVLLRRRQGCGFPRDCRATGCNADPIVIHLMGIRHFSEHKWRSRQGLLLTLRWQFGDEALAAFDVHDA
jgi:hypothetical protein